VGYIYIYIYIYIRSRRWPWSENTLIVQVLGSVTTPSPQSSWFMCVYEMSASQTAMHEACHKHKWAMNLAAKTSGLNDCLIRHFYARVGAWSLYMCEADSSHKSSEELSASMSYWDPQMSPTSSRLVLNFKNQTKTNSVALSPRANYTDWATATCRRIIVPTFVDRGVSRGQRGGSPTVVNLSRTTSSRPTATEKMW
jgi:hypothetical protein